MDTTTGIAIFGVVATFIFGGIAVWLAIRRRYPGKITYFQESCIGLFDSIVRNLPDLKVLYKSDPVSENIVLLKGYIMNTGSKDITKEMVEEPLTLRLPESFRWLDAKVVQSQTQVKANLSIKEAMRAEFDLGLFRVNEHVKFEALAEVPAVGSQNKHGRKENAASKLKNAVKVVHRVADTQKVTASKLPSAQSFKEFFVAFAISSVLGLGLLSLGMAHFPTSGMLNEKELNYLITTQPGDTVEVKIDVARDGMLVAKGVDKPLEKRLLISEFFAGCNFKPKVNEKKDYVGSIFIASMGFILLWFSLDQWKQYKNSRKVRRLLSLE